MRVEELLTNEVIERFRLQKETSGEREALIYFASKVLGRKVTYTCRNCYFDALIELINLYKTNQTIFEERMQEKRYQIKRGVCMPLGFGSSRMIVYQNCTDSLAIEFLSLNEDNCKYFEQLPSEWKDDVAEFLGKKSEKDILPAELTQDELNTIADMVKMMFMEGATKKAIKEHFMNQGKIGEKKVTNRYVDSLLKEATEQFEAEKSKKASGQVESDKITGPDNDKPAGSDSTDQETGE